MEDAALKALEDFSRAGAKIADQKQEAINYFNESIMPLIKKLCSLPEKDGGKFEIIEQSNVEQSNRENVLGGVGYLVKGTVVSSINFKIKERGSFDLSTLKVTTEWKLQNSNNAARALGEWVEEIAPNRRFEMGSLPEKKKHYACSCT